MTLEPGHPRPAELDLAAIRADTPAAASLTHLNNAGAALPPAQVVDAVVGHLRREEAEGGYEAAEAAAGLLDAGYAGVAELLHCDAAEIALVESATVGWNMAFRAIPFRPGDRILTGKNEYASNYLAFLGAARRSGVTVEIVPDDEHGQLDVDTLAGMLDDRVRLVAVTHVPTNGGLVNPAEAIGKLTRASGVLYLLDACQSVGQLPVDVQAIGCDLLSFTGRKYLRAPRGTGGLYVRQDRLEQLDPPFLDLFGGTWTGPTSYQVRPDARRFECWERNIAATLGFGVAVEYALRLGVHNTWPRIQQLADLLRTRLDAVPGVRVRDKGLRRCGIVSFDVAGYQPAEVRAALAAQRINVSVSEAPATLLDMAERNLAAVVRSSVHYYNTVEEIDRCAAAVADLR